MYYISYTVSLCTLSNDHWVAVKASRGAHTCTFSWTLCITNIWRAFAHRGIWWLIGSHTLVATNQCYIMLITKKLFQDSIDGLCQCSHHWIDSSPGIYTAYVSRKLCNLVKGRFMTYLRITSSFVSESSSKQEGFNICYNYVFQVLTVTLKPVFLLIFSWYKAVWYVVFNDWAVGTVCFLSSLALRHCMCAHTAALWRCVFVYVWVWNRFFVCLSDGAMMVTHRWFVCIWEWESEREREGEKKEGERLASSI